MDDPQYQVGMGKIGKQMCRAGSVDVGHDMYALLPLLLLELMVLTLLSASGDERVLF
jgi:hypothetical protein